MVNFAHPCSYDRNVVVVLHKCISNDRKDIIILHLGSLTNTSISDRVWDTPPNDRQTATICAKGTKANR